MAFKKKSRFFDLAWLCAVNEVRYYRHEAERKDAKHLFFVGSNYKEERPRFIDRKVVLFITIPELTELNALALQSRES